MNAKSVSEKLDKDRDLNPKPAPVGTYTFAFDRYPDNATHKPGWRYTEPSFTNIRDALSHAVAYDGTDRGELRDLLIIAKRIPIPSGAPLFSTKGVSPHLAEIVATVDVAAALKQYELECAKRVLQPKDIDMPGYKEAFAAISEYLQGAISAWELDEAMFKLNNENIDHPRTIEPGSRETDAAEVIHLLLNPNEPTDPTQCDISVAGNVARLNALVVRLANDPEAEIEMQEQSLRSHIGRAMTIPSLSQGVAIAKKLPLESIGAPGQEEPGRGKTDKEDPGFKAIMDSQPQRDWSAYQGRRTLQDDEKGSRPDYIPTF